MLPPPEMPRAVPGRTGAGHEGSMTETQAHRTLIRLYLLQAQRYNASPADDPATSATALSREDDPVEPLPPSEAGGDETAYAEGLVLAAQQISGCNCGELLAGGYALRRWAQRRPLPEQHAWIKAGTCPHVTLVDGLASAAFSGSRTARDWYNLAASLRSVTLDGTSRVPVLNDYIIDWVEENSDYLV